MRFELFLAVGATWFDDRNASEEIVDLACDDIKVRNLIS